MKIEVELPEIDGYEYTGEFRLPNEGEYYLNDSSPRVENASFDFHASKKHILRKLPTKLKITRETTIGEVMDRLQEIDNEGHWGSCNTKLAIYPSSTCVVKDFPLINVLSISPTGTGDFIELGGEL